ncbi:hypothetical protein GJB62_34860 (plasmid) [Nostoc sp. ATCC 53789]|nr:hypothetical protein GJB62_34860 [Nostoc sp. ATCC 53789]
MFRGCLSTGGLGGTLPRLQDTGSANLSSAKLSSADLRDAKLRQADLRNADLRRVNLRHADLRGADLSVPDLSGAELSDIVLNGARNLTPEQVKKAVNWEKASYSEEFRVQLGLSPKPIK